MEPPVESGLAQALQALERASAERAASPPPYERRQAVRVQCRQELLCRVGDRDVAATSLDLSLGGMRLTFADPVPDEIELELLRRPDDAEGIRARLAWRSADGRAGGVQFVAEELRGWMLDLLQGLFGDPRGMVNRRRYIRATANLPARLVTRSGEVSGLLLDLGLGGALWETAEALSPGAEVLVVFTSPAGEELCLPGRVLHALDDGHRAQHRLEFADLGERLAALEECVLHLLHGVRPNAA